MNLSNYASADCCLKDGGGEHKPQLASEASASKEDLVNEPDHPQTRGRRLEIILLSVVILAVCALFVTPTILYALPPKSAIGMVS